jgi:hypothetical protein
MIKNIEKFKLSFQILSLVLLLAPIILVLICFLLGPSDISYRSFCFYLKYDYWFHERPLGLMLFLLAWIISLTYPFHRKWKLTTVLCFFYFLWPLCPIDIYLEHYPGAPRFVHVGMGLPGPKMSAAAEQGNLILGGCMVNGFEPKWVLVVR